MCFTPNPPRHVMQVHYAVQGGSDALVAEPVNPKGTSYTYTPSNCVTYSSANIFVALLKFNKFGDTGGATVVTYSIKDKSDGSVSGP